MSRRQRKVVKPQEPNLKDEYDQLMQLCVSLKTKIDTLETPALAPAPAPAPALLAVPLALAASVLLLGTSLSGTWLMRIGFGT